MLGEQPTSEPHPQPHTVLLIQPQPVRGLFRRMLRRVWNLQVPWECQCLFPAEGVPGPALQAQVLQSQLAQGVPWDCRARSHSCAGESWKQGPQGTLGIVPHIGGAGTWGGIRRVTRRRPLTLEHSGLRSWVFSLWVLCCALLMASAVLFKLAAGVGLESVTGPDWAATTLLRYRVVLLSPGLGWLSPAALQPQAPGLQGSIQLLLLTSSFLECLPGLCCVWPCPPGAVVHRHSLCGVSGPTGDPGASLWPACLHELGVAEVSSPRTLKLTPSLTLRCGSTLGGSPRIVALCSSGTPRTLALDPGSEGVLHIPQPCCLPPGRCNSASQCACCEPWGLKLGRGDPAHRDLLPPQLLGALPAHQLSWSPAGSPLALTCGLRGPGR
ncbi:uncharacterized protein LOC125619087 [Marmota marmota marmota]|uniref:uncharacterized protein LOC125619087 n=1 Tax=Marmota marmota marmota TaxID=9994 RepID=UPI002093A6C3|nr:uncharacterized protein LOC125619087 [Marmota marmota marmota]